MPRSIRESLESQPLSGLVLEVGAQWKGSVPHPSPARMMAFSLSGCTRVTASSGESHTFVAGDCSACSMGIYPPLKLGHLSRRDVRFGSKADTCSATQHVCFTPESDIK